MRRIIHTTTAISACIALLMPQIAAAELRVPDAEASKQAEARSTAMPRLAAALQDELAAGLDVDSLLCANGAPRPCDDKVRLLTPGGLVVQVARNDTIFLARRADQMNHSDPQADAPAVMAEATTEELVDALTSALAEAGKGDAAAAKATAATEAAKARAAAEARPARRAADAQKAAEAALAAALAAEREAARKAAAAQRPAVLDDGSGNLKLAESNGARRNMTDQPRLARILTAEVAAGLTLDELTCQTGEAQPCPKGIAMMTPRGLAVVANRQGDVALLAASRQINTVTSEGKVIPRAPESDTVETAAAREAAAAAAAPVAAALQAGAGKGRLVEDQKLTRDNTRSSADDFEASLRAALEQAVLPAGRPASAQKSAGTKDNDNDLAKALILGLGAVAVGSMLNNNRQVALSAPDRVVVQRADGSQEVIKDEVALLRQPGSTVATENFDDGSSRTIVTREDGSKVVTIRDADLRVLRRTLISADGKSTMLIDDTADVRPVDVASLPEPAPVQTTTGTLSEEQLRAALQRESKINRRFTLGQIRNIPEVRALVAPVNIDAITFDSGSAAINPSQAQQLASLGRVIQDAIAKNPREVFMIEGHTDTVGANAMNLALSDRRAESVALALSEYFDVPPENMVVQGYGEQFLKVRAEGDLRANRRASVRRITELLQTAQAN